MELIIITLCPEIKSNEILEAINRKVEKDLEKEESTDNEQTVFPAQNLDDF